MAGCQKNQTDDGATIRAGYEDVEKDNRIGWIGIILLVSGGRRVKITHLSLNLLGAWPMSSAGRVQ